MNKILLIGLDGATWDNLERWIVDDELPLLKKLISEGGKDYLLSTIPSITCPALPSFYTGSPPTMTGAFSFRNGSGNIIRSQDIKGDRFWDELCDKGKKVFVSSIVTTYPAFIHKGGVMVTDPFLSTENNQFVYPDTERIFFNDYLLEPMNRNNGLRWQKEDRQRLMNEYMINEERRFKIVNDYLKGKDFDLIITYFLATDRIQHLLWNSQELVLEAYQRTETMIKELISNHPEHKIIIFSDHGFGPSPNKAFYINQWLENKGLLKYVKGVKTREGIYKRLMYGAGWLMEKYLPMSLYEKVHKKLKGNNDYHKELFIEQGQTNEKLLSADSKVHLSQKWGLWVKNDVNKKELINDMKELTDGEVKVFDEVHLKEEFYPGSEKVNIPHIIFTLNPFYEPRTGTSKKFFSKIIFKRRQEGSHDNQRKGIIISNDKSLLTNNLMSLSGKIKEALL